MSFERGPTVASFDRGTKRQCLYCGTKFYDLNRDPILCPHCGKPFQVTAERVAHRHEEKVAEVEEVEVEAAADEAGAEIVSLEEADAEEAGGDDDIPEVDDVEEVEDIGDDDDVFLETDEDDDDIEFDVEEDEDDV
ncbi:MAG TPA: TIGR02300 family protein [Devosiaceae bacterium]